MDESLSLSAEIRTDNRTEANHGSRCASVAERASHALGVCYLWPKWRNRRCSNRTATQSGELDSLDMNAEHVMPPELPTQDSALEDSVGQLSRVRSKLVDTLHSLQLLPPHLVKDHNRAVRAVQEALTLVGDTDDSEAIGPIDWVKFGERLYQRRTAAGLTQEWLADRVGVTSTTVRQLEHHTRKARRSLMLKLLAVPELNLRVSDIELSAEMSAGYRLSPTSWLGPTYDPVGMVTELTETLNGQSGQLEQTLMYIDPQSAKDWMTTCSSPEYGPEYRDSIPLLSMARRIAELVGEQALTINALGCGDGRTEALLTKYLQQTLRMPKQTELFLLDVSHFVTECGRTGTVARRSPTSAPTPFTVASSTCQRCRRWSIRCVADRGCSRCSEVRC